MIERIIRWSVHNRFMVLMLAAGLAAWGMWSMFRTPLDALPDLSDVQVIVKTTYPGQAPQVVEDQVTYPLTTAMLAVPGAVNVRGYSFFNDSFVYIIFEDGTDLYWARSRVLEYLSQVAPTLPESARPALGPDATGVGWVYQYALVDRTGKHDLGELRALQDWFLKYELQTVEGVSEVATIGANGKDNRVLTELNADVLPFLDMAKVEELHVASSADGREIEAWVALPPDFKPDGSFPMILEIHGGPYAMYSPFFGSEIQRYAAEGYVTVWSNPRGSTGYGEDFAQLIDLAYPGNDYDDLMSVVDDLVAKDYVDEDRLFITGGSGGGILTAWTVTKTDRFAAAASIKPVINWMTMALAGDISQFVRRHWIRADPWSDPEAFLKFSPIRYVDKVTTPTMIMVGEEDYRTPAWEAEQFYTALKMNGVDTVYVRVPGSPHYIASRPSRLIAKTDNIMGWFAKYDPAKKEDAAEDGGED